MTARRRIARPAPRPTAFWLAAGLLAGAFPAAAADPADPLAVCEARFAENPQAEFVCGCFYSVGARQPDLAEESLRRLAGHLERDPGNGCLLFSLGRFERRLQRGEARGHLLAAAAAYARAAQPEGETYARLNLTDLFGEAGELAAAEAQLDLTARAAAAAAANPQKAYLPVEVEVRRSRLWLQHGEDLEKVEALLRRAERSFPQAHDSLQRDTLETLGGVLHQLGRHDEAEATYRRMIEVTRRPNWSGRPDQHGEAVARLNLAVTYLARPPGAANLAAAKERLEEALEAAVASRHRMVEAEIRRNLGRLLDGEAARRQLEASVAAARELADPLLLRLGLDALAAEIAAGDPRRAAALFAEAEQIELAAPAPELLIYGWFDRMAASWQLHGRGEAIRRALAELAAIEKQRTLQQDSLTRAETFSVWADAYSWLAGRFLEAGEAPRAFALLERRHARVLLESAGGSPALPAAGEEFASLAEAQAALAADQAMLYFQQAYERDNFGDFAGGSWLLAITRNATRLYRTADPLVVDQLRSAFAGLLAGGADADAAATRMGSAVLGAAIADLPAGVGRLVVVPDEGLQLLSFAALRPGSGQPRLAERFEISLVPSATVWLRLLRRPEAPSPPAAVLVLADPEKAMAPRSLLPLPGARREGREVVDAVGGASDLRLGPQASEAGLAAAELSRFGILHFAVHALHGLPGPRSERSAIVLAPGGPEADGLLHAREIRRLHLEGQAVVLSACRGAAGEILAGEGALSLASAFFTAGARVVVAGLWNLEDRAAARFSERFYRRLGAGESAGAAFAAAQRESIAAGESAAAWAGLVLLGDGDWRMAPAAPAPRWPAALVALAAVVLLAALLAGWRFRRAKAAAP